MEFNQLQPTEMHYLMIMHVVETQKLNLSCFNHFWEDFKSKNPDVEASADELKVLFWRRIMPNVNLFDRLTEDQKDYLKVEDSLLEIADGTLSDSIVCNESKSNGRDFLLCQSTAEFLKNAEPMGEVEKTFRQPTKSRGVFGFESDQDSDDENLDNCVKIKREKPPMETAIDPVEGNLAHAFNAFLRPPNQKKMLGPEEIHEKLRNPNVLSSLDDFKNLPPGMQQFLKQMKFFKNISVPQIEVEGPTPSTSSTSQSARSMELTGNDGTSQYPSTRSRTSTMQSSTSMELTGTAASTGVSVSAGLSSTGSSDSSKKKKEEAAARAIKFGKKK